MTRKQTLSYFEDILQARGLVDYIAVLEEVSGQKVIESFAGQLQTAWKGHVQRLDVLRRKHGARLGRSTQSTPKNIFFKLQERLANVEQGLVRFFAEPSFETLESWRMLFERLGSQVAQEDREGFFLKENVCNELLRAFPPKNIMRFLGYDDVDNLLAHEDVFEIMASLRFGETKDWMHAFFRQYENLRSSDFETRQIQWCVLDPQKWAKLSDQFQHQKFHQLSHLKEFGLIFFLPQFKHSEKYTLIKPLSLFLHYVHEIHFYSEFFQSIAQQRNFTQIMITMLKGDVQIITPTHQRIPILHQYHLKDAHPDPRAFQPHVHTEVLHWQRSVATLLSFLSQYLSQEDMTLFEEGDILAQRIRGRLVSMNFSDLAIDERDIKTYHIHEALWNAIFVAHFSSDVLRKALLTNLSRGYIDVKNFSL